MLTLISRLVELSRRNAALVTAVIVLLTIAGGFYGAAQLSIDTDLDKLINPELPWRKLEKALDEAFPQNVDTLVVVVDANTPDLAADATSALMAKLEKLTATTTLFKTVRRPDGGTFFQQNGLL